MSEEKQMTPLQELIKRLEYDNVYQSEEIKGVIKLAQSLLPKEKEGIITAYREGFVSGINIPKPYKTDEQYFNEKYTQ